MYWVVRRLYFVKGYNVSDGVCPSSCPSSGYFIITHVEQYIPPQKKKTDMNITIGGLSLFFLNDFAYLLGKSVSQYAYMRNIDVWRSKHSLLFILLGTVHLRICVRYVYYKHIALEQLVHSENTQITGTMPDPLKGHLLVRQLNGIST